MKLIHGADLEFRDTGLKHRPNAPVFKFLALGEENTPSNFFLMIGRQQSFYSPRHRHNFDQFRYCYRGDISIGDGPGGNLMLREGELAYFPEGVEYGPQDDGPDVKDVLVLQFGGASGQGFLSFAQLKSIQDEMTQKGLGSFEGGKFKPATTAEDGEGQERDLQVRDGYEALWEYHNQKPLEYPPAKYRYPILISPDNFPWKGVDEAGHVQTKLLGVFSDGSVSVEIVKLQNGGTLKFPPKTAIQLFFVTKGFGEIGGKNIKQESTVQLDVGEEAEVKSNQGVEMIHFTMACFS
jgi:hypothetical protein